MSMETAAALAALAATMEYERQAQRLRQSLHSAQLAAVRSILEMDRSVRRVALLCSRRAGKSWLIAITFVVICLLHPGARCLWLGLTQKSIKRIAWDIIKRIDAAFGLGMRSNRVELTWTLPSGSVIELDGADHLDPDKYRGASLTAIAVDEAGSFPRSILQELWDEVLRPALVDQRGFAIFAGTARLRPVMDDTGSEGLYYDAVRGRLAEWTHYHWTAAENPSTARQMAEEMAEIKAARPGVEREAWYRREYLGELVWDQSDLVHHRFSIQSNVCRAAVDASSMRYVIGLDPGYSDASGCVVVGWRRHSTVLHVMKSWSQKSLLTHQIAERIKSLLSEYPGAVVVVDPAWKTTLQDLRQRYGLPIIEAKKVSKQQAIEAMNSDWARGRLIVQELECQDLLREIQSLTWVYNKSGKREEDPTADNHCSDALLYAWRHATNWDERPEKSVLEKSPRPDDIDYHRDWQKRKERQENGYHECHD